MQEHAEAEYRRRFPDNFAAFADLKQSDDMLVDTPHTQAQAPAASQAQAGSAHAQGLLGGEFLSEVVQLHMRLYPAQQQQQGVDGADRDWEAGFGRAYDLGSSLARAAGEQGLAAGLQAEGAEGLASGHLLQGCLMHMKLLGLHAPPPGGAHYTLLAALIPWHAASLCALS